MMAVDSGAIMRCIKCSCQQSRCEGGEYRVNNYTGHVMYQQASGWAWVRIQVPADDVDAWFPTHFPGHHWRNVGS
jgi:hypothetical protein